MCSSRADHVVSADCQALLPFSNCCNWDDEGQCDYFHVVSMVDVLFGDASAHVNIQIRHFTDSIYSMIKLQNRILKQGS